MGNLINISEKVKYAGKIVEIGVLKVATQEKRNKLPQGSDFRVNNTHILQC